MTVPNVNQLEASPSLSTSSHRDSPIWGVPKSSMRIAQAQDAVNILDGSSPSSRPRPLQEDGLIRHEEFHEDLKATKTGGHCRTSVLNIIVKPRDRDSSPRNGLTHRPGGS